MAATPLLLGLCLMTLVTEGLDQGWSAVLLPVHVRQELDGAVDLGLLNAAFGVCALTGALVYGAVGSRFRRWSVFAIAFLIGGLRFRHCTNRSRLRVRYLCGPGHTSARGGLFVH